VLPIPPPTPLPPGHAAHPLDARGEGGAAEQRGEGTWAVFFISFVFSIYTNTNFVYVFFRFLILMYTNFAYVCIYIHVVYTLYT
jgi:hypothetical protein